MKNYELLYLMEDNKFFRILLEFGERTKPVICKNVYAFETFTSDKDFNDITEKDPEITQTALNIFGMAYDVKEFRKQFPDKDFAAIAKWEPDFYKIVLAKLYRSVEEVPIAVPKIRPIICTSPKQLEWQVSSWSYDLVLKKFKYRIL